MNYYLIAGETSGEQHGALLMKFLREVDPKVSFRGVGGPSMIDEGLECVVDTAELSVMGVYEVVKSIFRLRKLFNQIVKDICQYKPDILILIDFPGMNLRIAKAIKSRTTIPICYFILPKAWAWKQGRVGDISAYVDLPISILPFELPFFRAHGVHAQYFGNPSQYKVANYLSTNKTTEVREKIVCLPGSRRQEVKAMMPVIVDLSVRMPNHQFVIVKVAHLDERDYNFDAFTSNMSITAGYFDALQAARVAIVNSGTASLEVALFDIPQVVCYKMHPITYALAKRLVKLPYISLPNLISGTQIVKELLQDAYNTINLYKEINRLLDLGSNDGSKMYEIFRHHMTNKFEGLLLATTIREFAKNGYKKL